MGKDEVVANAMTAILAGGHILLEDVPGVGKTTLGHAFARVLGCSFRRIQFTSDLLPSDIIGVSIFHRDGKSLNFDGGHFREYRPADEINRTTQNTIICKP